MRVTASKFRENLYGILDQALETGVPVEVIRKGKILKVVPDVKPDKMNRFEEAEIHRRRSRQHRTHELAPRVE